MDNEQGVTGDVERTLNHAHCAHCGGVCILKVHVKNGVITRIETDDGEEPQYRACARGRAMRQRVHSPDRILHPLKRAGQRGEGKFVRVSWDEALSIVSKELRRVRDTYGPEAILLKMSGGDLSVLHTGRAHFRLLSMFGGFSTPWGIHSFEGAVYSQIATYGTILTSNSREDLLNSRLIIMWGWNPADTIMHTNTAWYLAQAREKGIGIVSVDPRFTNTAKLCQAQWIPIRPGTDTAMVLAMAHVIISRDLQQHEFIDRHTIGFGSFRSYVLGEEDGIPKTPKWAEAITGVLAETTELLAVQYATTRPSALMSGISAGRTAYGEQFHRATAVLAAITGNVGVHGGDAAANSWVSGMRAFPFQKLGRAMPVPPNPADATSPPRANALPDWDGCGLSRTGPMSQAQTGDAILRGKSGGYETDFRLLYVVNNSFPNQYLNLNKAIQGLKSKSLEFSVFFEQFMTPGAKFADIVLPVNTDMERNDITVSDSFVGFMAKAIDPVGESRSHLEICEALADKLGVQGFNELSEEEWLRQIASAIPGVTSYDDFKKAGGTRVGPSEPHVAFKSAIDDPDHNPFPTPSGKIEIFCQRMADWNNPLLPPIPKYIEPGAGAAETSNGKYPLKLISTHLWRRAHSQFDNIPWLKELEPQSVEISTIDAEARGIKTGDLVRVHNSRGQTILPAKVTQRIMPGVVNIPEGAWYCPDENKIDRGGSANVLTKDEHSPAGAYVTNGSPVQVELARDERKHGLPLPLSS